MPFIHTYNGAMNQLKSIEKGTCMGRCKTSWIRNFRYALKTKTNPLKLTSVQRKTLKAKIEAVSKRNPQRTSKKYVTRKSPPYSAAQYCGKKMEGNDGQMYESRANKNGVCAWKKYE